MFFVLDVVFDREGLINHDMRLQMCGSSNSGGDRTGQS